MKRDSNGDPKPHRDEARALEADRLDFAGHEIASRWGDTSGIEDGECGCAECRTARPQWGRPGTARMRFAPQEPGPAPEVVAPLTDRPFARLMRVA